ncbi:MAG: hypothetical protein R3E95_09840 [Thiolinea sp.]
MLTDLLSRELRRDGNNPLADLTESVDPPYLQIVCSQLWDREAGNPGRLLRMQTYRAAGGAKGLLENYIRDTLQFPNTTRRWPRAPSIMISRHGAEMPYTPEDLASAIGADWRN